jgi:acetolactate synthase-1/2/3 large subunit
VVIALPEDMLTAMSDASPCKPVTIAEAAPAPDAIKALKAELEKAERPLIITGGGGWTDKAALTCKPLPRPTAFPCWQPSASMTGSTT